MEKRILGKTGFAVSVVSYGGIVSATNYADCSFTGNGQAASDYCVSWSIEQGVNYFDVSPRYGDAQQHLGKSLMPYRQGVYLACKTKQRRRVEAEAEMKESLELLHTDYFDTYQIHSLSTKEDLESAFGSGGRYGTSGRNERKRLDPKVGFYIP